VEEGGLGGLNGWGGALGKAASRLLFLQGMKGSSKPYARVRRGKTKVVYLRGGKKVEVTGGGKERRGRRSFSDDEAGFGSEKGMRERSREPWPMSKGSDETDLRGGDHTAGDLYWTAIRRGGT